MRIKSSVLLLVSLGLSSTSGAGEAARQWLDRMHRSLDQLNYVGTFVRFSNGNAETMQVTHRHINGELDERIYLLDGTEREILRRDDDVRVIYPDEGIVIFEKAVASNPLYTAFPNFSQTLEPHYELREYSTDRVAGRPTQVIGIKPRDDLRYGYVLWLDWDTALPLKSRSWNDEEQTIEEILFTSIDFPDAIPDEAFEQVIDTAGYTELHSSEPRYELSHDEPWTIEGLPAGFELTASMLKSVSDSSYLVKHLVYSDGLATVSVFIDRQDAEASVAEGFYRVGSTNACALTKDGRRITAVGEVPLRTVEAIASTLRARTE